jgi:hypothetical protein
VANRNVNNLLSQLSQPKRGTRLNGGSTTITNLVVPLSSAGSSSKSLALGRLSDIRAAGITGPAEVRGIQFGSPSSTRSTPASTQSGWSKLLTQAGSGGVASLLGNGLGVGGLGSLISGIFHLFGGGSSKPLVPALVRFQLPASQTETAYIGSQSHTVFQGMASMQSIRSTTQPIYAPAGTQKSTSPSSTVTYDTAAITQAVKQALLNSSSLNDVIAEI